MELLRSLLARRRLVATGGGYEVTRTGRAWLESIGVDASASLRGERYAYGCLDWSERRDHMAGRLATALLDHFLAKRWLARIDDTRALRLTPEGKRNLPAIL